MTDLRCLSFALLAITALTVPSIASAKAFQDPIPPPPEYHDIRSYGLGNELTVVIAFGAECEACKESLPFYKRLLSANGMDGKRNRFVVLSTDGVAPVTVVLERAGFKPHAVISYPRQSKLRELSDQAPELVILDASGRPLRTWRGRLSSTQETEVLELLSKSNR